MCIYSVHGCACVRVHGCVHECVRAACVRACAHACTHFNDSHTHDMTNKHVQYTHSLTYTIIMIIPETDHHKYSFLLGTRIKANH